MTALVCWWDDAADGPVNMATDEALAAEAERSHAVLVRLYGWTRTTLSLGGFQPVALARGHAELAGLPLVRRPSGGGAIIHGSDLTYAVAVPKEHPWGKSPQTLYDAFHGALVAELASRQVVARLHDVAATDNVVSTGGAVAEAFLCFDRRATGDVIVASGVAEGWPPEQAGRKVLGSAQRRLAGVVLQHGSLLWRSNPDIPVGCRHPGITDFAAPLLGGDPHDLARVWLDRVAGCFGGRLDERQQFAAGREAVIARHAERFRDDRWTARR